MSHTAVATALDLNGPALSPCGHWLLFNQCGKGDRLYRMRISHTPTMMLDKTTLATPTMMLDGSLNHCLDVDVANVLKLGASVIICFGELRSDLYMIPISGRGVQDT
mgnify:CR=1 FL=1